MTAKSTSLPAVGALVRVAGRRGLALVVTSDTRVDVDRMRGDSYSVDEFSVVTFDATTSRGSMVDPKVTKYYFKGGSMTGEGNPIERADVQVVGSATVKTKVKVEYIFTSAKLD